MKFVGELIGFLAEIQKTIAHVVIGLFDCEVVALQEGLYSEVRKGCVSAAKFQQWIPHWFAFGSRDLKVCEYDKSKL